MRKYVIMGIQGSGKGTHAKMLAGDFDLEHIAVGDIFRWNLQHHTKLGAQVRRTMAAGLLVDDDLVEGVVKQRLSEHDWNYGFIIDGFPRNQRQAEFFLESYDLDGVIHRGLSRPGACPGQVSGRSGDMPAAAASRRQADAVPVPWRATSPRQRHSHVARSQRPGSVRK